MRILVWCLGFLLLVAPAPQTSNEFRARYGNPDVERFTARPHVALTAEYGLDGHACRMRIEYYPDPSPDSSDQAPPPMEEVTAVLDEMVPLNMRGKLVVPDEKIRPEFYGAAPPMEYENVRIKPYYGHFDKVPTAHGVDVYFKRPACEFDPK
jgi:hypothetical protein